MDKRQEEKFRRFMDSRYQGGVPPFDKYRDLVASRFFNDAWQACLDANGIESTPEPTLIDLMREISASVKDIAKKLKPEVMNVEAKEWTPKEGDAVFTRDIHGDVIVCRIVSIDKGMHELDWFGKSSGLTSKCAIGLIKPFNPSAIGKPWSDI